MSRGNILFGVLEVITSQPSWQTTTNFFQREYDDPNLAELHTARAAFAAHINFELGKSSTSNLHRTEWQTELTSIERNIVNTEPLTPTEHLDFTIITKNAKTTLDILTQYQHKRIAYKEHSKQTQSLIDEPNQKQERQLLQPGWTLTKNIDN